MDTKELFFLYFFLISVVTFFVYVHDKHQAYYSNRRVPEFLLLALSFMGGAMGAMSAMLLFRHKTQHTTFRICVPVFMAIHIIVILLMSLFVFI